MRRQTIDIHSLDFCFWLFGVVLVYCECYLCCLDPFCRGMFFYECFVLTLFYCSLLLMTGVKYVRVHPNAICSFVNGEGFSKGGYTALK